MKKILLSLLAVQLLVAADFAAPIHRPGDPVTFTISTDKLKDKIRGGWAGQTIGVTYGGPVEFRFNGTFIQDYQPIVWYDGYLKKTMTENPGLYDDIYMDLTFVDVLERVGLDAPVDSFAQAFAHADYKLWHANQAARYNILNGIKPPASGTWMNNPHADDIDYQIEADFSGLMSPGMPNAASAISDRIGHMMNYGDGYYGGVFVGAMYSYAFISDDITYITNQALKKIPAQSEFYQCISDVIAWHKKYPADWKSTWFELQKKWSMENGCPQGVFAAFDIDAKINAAYVVLGLLYGNGDFGKSLEIAARAGQDADCNPSTVGGILGAKMGYDKIPAYWKAGLKDIEDMDFKYTTMSLNRVYAVSYNHALQMIRRNGGTVTDKTVQIKLEDPKTVPFEKSFAGIYPASQIDLRDEIGDSEKEISFTGTGIVLKGEATRRNRAGADKIIEASFWVDGQDAGTYKFPTDFTTRRLELFWKYGLTKGEHKLRIKINNPQDGYVLRCMDAIVYENKPATSK
jgi:ADP-ribosylglycohydrolase